MPAYLANALRHLQADCHLQPQCSCRVSALLDTLTCRQLPVDTFQSIIRHTHLYTVTCRQLPVDILQSLVRHTHLYTVTCTHVTCRHIAVPHQTHSPVHSYLSTSCSPSLDTLTCTQLPVDSYLSTSWSPSLDTLTCTQLPVHMLPVDILQSFIRHTHLQTVTCRHLGVPR